MVLFTMKQIMEAIGTDASNARKYALSKGFKFMRTRTQESKGQETLCLNEDDFNKLIQLRKQEGYILPSEDKPVIVTTNSGYGWFYIIQLLPDIYPNRLKLGYTSNWGQRMASHRTTCPNLNVLIQHKAKEVWELAIIDMLCIADCKRVGTEVIDVINVDDFIEYAKDILSKFPTLEAKENVIKFDVEVKTISEGEKKVITV